MKAKAREELKSQQVWQNYEWKEILYYLREFWHRYRGYQQLKTIVERQNIGNILDVGCGIVSVLNLIAEDYTGLNLVGVDPLIGEYSRIHKPTAAINWSGGYAEYLPFSDESFDLVISSNAIDHVENLDDSLHEIARVLKPDGYIYITTHVFTRHASANKDRGSAHPHNPAPKQLIANLEAVGLQVNQMALHRHIPTGVAGYLMMRIDKARSPKRIRVRYELPTRIKSYVKQVVNRGSLGEVIITGRNSLSSIFQA